jgi:hypothetical protein
MAAVVHYLGLELPEFDPEIPLLKFKDQFRDASRFGSDTFQEEFLRPVTVTGEGSLENILEIAADQFNTVAAACGAKVVEHTIGLYRLSPHNVHLGKRDSSTEGLLPHGYTLAANVVTIINATPLDDDKSIAFGRKIHAHQESRRSKGLPVISDMRSEHFVEADPSINKHRFHLVDIEPKTIRFTRADQY